MTKKANKWTMKEMIDKNINFSYCFVAWYATYNTFQQIFRPSGSIEEGKAYFIGKHKLYIFTVDTSVLPNALAVGCSIHYLGFVLYLRIFKRNKFHSGYLNPLGPFELDPSWGNNLYENHWCITFRYFSFWM